MERIIQFLDEVDEILAVFGHVWEAASWRLAGFTGLFIGTLAAVFPV